MTVKTPHILADLPCIRRIALRPVVDCAGILSVRDLSYENHAA